MKKLVSLLFHRVVLVAFFLLIQVAVLVVMLLRFNNYFLPFYGVCVAISLFAVFWIVGRQSDPAYKIAWIIPILVFPIFGGLFYLLFGGNRLSSRTRRKMEGTDRKMEEVLRPDYKADELSSLGEDAVHQARYLEHIAHCPVYGNTETEYYPLGELCFTRMVEELKRAERYIFVEYFIIEEGKMWDTILDILKDKAQEGVDVRVMYDDIGSMFTLPRDYARELEARTGIKCCVFNPFVPILSLRLNNRDHRKFCIIDGHTAFTGGINLADEYINAYEKHGHWKDTSILLKGEAVFNLTVMFLSMWDYLDGTTGKTDYSRYYPTVWDENAKGYVQPFADNPLDDEAVGETVYLNLINKAKRYVYITTPYLILSSEMFTALTSAAKCGVDVRIITPHVPDKWYVHAVSRSHYQPLIEAGVKIYEYTPGFIHAKTFVVDDDYAVVGTINLDYRSLYLHFECAVWMYQTPSVAQVRDDFFKTQQISQEITLEECRSLSFPRRLGRSVLRVFAPLM